MNLQELDSDSESPAAALPWSRNGLDWHRATRIKHICPGVQGTRVLWCQKEKTELGGKERCSGWFFLLQATWTVKKFSSWQAPIPKNSPSGCDGMTSPWPHLLSRSPGDFSTAQRLQGKGCLGLCYCTLNTLAQEESWLCRFSQSGTF